MDITLNNQSTTEGNIKVSLQPDDYQQAVDQKVNEYRKKMNLKGFRPGKVPAGLVKKMYGKSILVEEINTILSKALSDYIREQDLNIVGEPLPNDESFKNIDWDSQEGFEFTYDIGLHSEFEVELSKVAGVTEYNIEVKEKEVDEWIENLRKQFGDNSSPEVSEAGDTLQGMIKPAGEEGEGQSAWLDIDDVGKRQQSKFIGKKEGEELTFAIEKVLKADKIATLLNITEEEAAEISGDYTLEVKTLHRTALAEVNQELFDKVLGEGTVSSEEEFRGKLEEQIASSYKQATDNQLKNDLHAAILENVSIELPEDFLKRMIRATNEQPISDEDMEKEFPEYLKQLRWDLISSYLSKKNEIKVEHEDIMEETKKMIRAQFGGQYMPQLEDQMDQFATNFLQDEKGNNYMRMFSQARGEKIMTLAMEQVKSKKKKVSADKFKELTAN